MESNPSRRTESVDNFIVIAGGIPTGTKVEGKEMYRHAHNQQQGCNSL